MRIEKVHHSVLAATITGALSYTGLAHSGGFQITELCAKCQGQRNAGAAATADSASTVYFNPAGLTRLTGNQAELSLHVIIPNFEFDDENSTNGIGGTPIGDRKNDGGTVALVPNTYVSHRINNDLVVGLGITAPYGLVTEYDKDWVGRYHAVKSDLLTIDINPALGYRINEQLSVGAGVSLQYINTQLTSALDFGTIGFLLGAPGITPSTPGFDGFNDLNGDDWSFGFNLGLLYEINPSTRLGIGYRSEINHTLDGNADITVPAPITALTGQASARRGVKADATMPAMVVLGAYHQLNTQWAVLAGATWTDWSTFDELRIEFDDGGPDSVQPENWEDSWRYSVGVNYFYSPEVTLRAGFEYDESPVRGVDRTPRIPDEDRYWFVLGAGYKHSEEFTFDVAYSYIYIPDYDIRDTEVTTSGLTGAPVGSTLDGDYTGSTHILSAQVQWNF